MRKNVTFALHSDILATATINLMYVHVQCICILSLDVHVLGNCFPLVTYLLKGKVKVQLYVCGCVGECVGVSVL